MEIRGVLWDNNLQMDLFHIYINIWLVVSTRLKNMKVSWDDYSQYMEK
jgi:hypothetical protein